MSSAFCRPPDARAERGTPYERARTGGVSIARRIVPTNGAERSGEKPLSTTFFDRNDMPSIH